MTPALQPPAPADNEEDLGIVAQTLVAYGQRVPVCSLHFKALKVERPFRTTTKEGYRHVYNLSAVESIEDHPIVLIVTDAYDKVFVRTNIMGQREYRDTVIMAKEIANDIAHVGSMASPNSGPGDVDLPAVWVPCITKDGVRTTEVMPESMIPKGKQWKLWEDKKEFAKIFPEFWAEAAAFKRRQHRWCHARVANADANYAKKLVHEISSLDRECAHFIGANEAEHPWIEFSTFGKLDQCPFCKAPVDVLASICQSCTRVINPELLKQTEAKLLAPAK